MSIELLLELEDKVGFLLQSLGDLKAENTALKESVGNADVLRRESEDLRSENEELKTQLEELKADADVQREKVDAVTDRVKDLLAKLDAAR